VIDDLGTQLGDIYTVDNVMLSATHSHSAPGGYHTYWMYQSVTLGFINETFNALVDGIVRVSQLLLLEHTCRFYGRLQ
jgi:neutral ceramidase